MSTPINDQKSAEALEKVIPMRILYSPLARDFDSADLANSIQVKLHDIVQSLPSENHSRPSPRFLAAECWGRRIHIVFDINHHNYNWETAHILEDNELPVFRVTSTKPTILIRATALDGRINERIAKIHNLNGFVTRPPYITDHTEGAAPICYTALRVKSAPI